MWRLLCPSWFRPRQALSNTRLGKSLASYNLGDKAYALALGPTTKLGWALRSVVAAGALYATGHYVRVHPSVPVIQVGKMPSCLFDFRDFFPAARIRILR